MLEVGAFRLRVTCFFNTDFYRLALLNNFSTFSDAKLDFFGLDAESLCEKELLLLEVLRPAV